MTPVIPIQREALTEAQRAEILSLWATRSYDTGQLAERVGASEAVVYAVIAGRPAKRKTAVPKAFAGKEPVKPRAERKKAVRVAPKPAPPAPRCQYRLRTGAHYLNKSGTGLARAATDAWQGNAEAALDYCAKLPLAKDMLMELVL